MLLLCLGCLPACNLDRPTPTPFPTPDLPRVEILAPPNQQKVIEGTEFDIDILAVDQSLGIRRIELYVDELFVKSSETTDDVKREYRVTMNWFAQGLGWHTVKAIAYRDDGTRSDEHMITLQVIPR
ncbi:MAG: Ig-like domain-containing protein [Chloroflexi bacterium]|nr:Ig-like domain-containing protein [Chloroflexota bacterium]